MHKFSTAVPQSSSVLHRLRCATRKRVPLALLSASFHRYGGVRGERDVCVYRGGGVTKKLMPSRRHPSGWWGLRATSLSLVVEDVPASPSPCSLISPRKPHQRTSPYLSSEALNPLHEYACGALEVPACGSHDLSSRRCGTSSQEPMHNPG